MATCPLTTGFDYGAGCDGTPGGVKAIYFCETYWQDTITVAAGVVTAMALDAGKVFRKYVPKKNTCFWTDNVTKSENGAVYYEPTVSMTLNSLETPLRQEVQLLAKNPLMIIVLGNDGVYRLFGYYTIMDFSTGEVNGGTLHADGTKQVLLFKGMDTVPALEVNAATATSLGL